MNSRSIKRETLCYPLHYDLLLFLLILILLLFLLFLLHERLTLDMTYLRMFTGHRVDNAQRVGLHRRYSRSTRNTRNSRGVSKTRLALTTSETCYVLHKSSKRGHNLLSRKSSAIVARNFAVKHAPNSYRELGSASASARIHKICFNANNKPGKRVCELVENLPLSVCPLGFFSLSLFILFLRWNIEKHARARSVFPRKLRSRFNV